MNFTVSSWLIKQLKHQQNLGGRTADAMLCNIQGLCWKPGHYKARQYLIALLETPVLSNFMTD